MNIAVYGVSNWDDKQQAVEQQQLLEQWHCRILKHIPQCSSVKICCGSYSPPEHNPIPKVDIVQLPFFRHAPYSKRNNYFHLGFMTGIWHHLINQDPSNLTFDLLVHCQCRTLLGEDMTPHIERFMERPEILMSPKSSSMIGTSIDVGLMFMKPKAALMYAATGFRQSCVQTDKCLNCEEEAFMLFKDSWYNAWPDVVTMKANDTSHIHGDDSKVSRFTYDNEELYYSLPFIAAGKHSNVLTDQWIESHPV